MLTKLQIQNYAIIDEITIQFSHQLNIITGETGAGKSILMGALSLILGDRADSAALRDKDKKCVVEGFFDVVHNKQVHQFLQENDLDNEHELLIRREIANNGKSRAFINDTPVTLTQLKTLANCLVDLHQQFDTAEIGDTAFQREVLDALSNVGSDLKEYQSSYFAWKEATHALQLLIEQKASFEKELDYFQFLYDELKELNLKEDELENLEVELKLLSNSEAIKSALDKVVFDLKETETPILSSLKSMGNQLQAFSNIHASLPKLIERIKSTQIELADIAEEAEGLSEQIFLDDKKIELINERLSIGYKLLKKHGVLKTNELLNIQSQLEEKLQAVLNIDDSISKSEKQVAQLFEKATKIATIISKLRNKQTVPFEKEVNKLLQQVGMPNARIQVDIKETALQEFGMNSIEFLFDANKSGRFEPIRKVASGGELSRLMLCIKSLVAKKIDLPTMIFDEIDTGISGEASKQVGIIMKEMAVERQIICITHQPQIAGKADLHLFVYKETKGNVIKTNIKSLDMEERVLSIAQMLSGEKPTAASLANAREMINN